MGELLENISSRQDSAVENQSSQPDKDSQVIHFSIPIEDNEKNAKLKVYYNKKDKESGKNSFKLSLLLVMDRLGDIRTDFFLVDKNINITFFVKRYEVKETLEAHIEEVRQNLEGIFQYLVLKVIISERKIAEFDTEDLDVHIVSNRILDLKA
ncbi:MAG: flagellar hook-length control protein FliK [bacterium]|nr:flagellar hook-length control protein FliK [bacterium]